MAPRRGGSRGGSSSGGSIDNQCDDYGAFSDGYSQAQIAIYGVILLFFLILAICVANSSGKRKKAGRRRTILRWYHYGIALFLVISSLILLIVRYTLVECGVIYPYLGPGSEFTAISVAVFVIFNLADLFLLGLILFLVTQQMFKLAGSENLRRAFLIIGIVLFTIVSVMFIARAVMNGVLAYEDYTSSRVVRSYRKLTEGFFVLSAILALYASLGLTVAAVKLWNKPERRLGIVGWVPVIIVGILIYFIYNVVNVFIAYHERDPDIIGILVGYGISLLGYFAAFFAIFMLARGTGWEYLDHAHAGESTIYQQYGNYGAPQPGPPHTQPIGGYPVSAPYSGVQPPIDPNKRTSYPQSTTPVPPYQAPGIPYSGGGVYNQPQQTYGPTSNWNSGGYAPAHPVSAPSPAPYHNPAFGVANRGLEPNELAGRT